VRVGLCDPVTQCVPSREDPAPVFDTAGAMTRSSDRQSPLPAQRKAETYQAILMADGSIPYCRRR
jgi:hypothetical protein